jgi:large subunit ribosomal protein L4
MKVKIIDIFTNKHIADKEVSAKISSAEVRKDIIKQVVYWQLNKARTGNHKVKTISEISGTTAKPFKQKGTGNARQGSKRATQFRGGATTFGPVVRTHNTKLPKKVRKLGLISSLSYHFQNKTITVISEPKLEKVTTSSLGKILDVSKKSLFIYSEKTDKNFLLSLRNIKNTDHLHSDGANVYDIINHDHIYLIDTALDIIEKRLAND